MFPKLTSIMRLLPWHINLAKPLKISAYSWLNALESTLGAQNFSVPA